jgi:hypothetical protein
MKGSGGIHPDRPPAAELAGDCTVMNDEPAHAFLDILADAHEPEALRGQVVISLGPALEQADTDGFENPDVPIAEKTFVKIQHDDIVDLGNSSQNPFSHGRGLFSEKVR